MCSHVKSEWIKVSKKGILIKTLREKAVGLMRWFSQVMEVSGRQEGAAKKLQIKECVNTKVTGNFITGPHTSK